MVCWALIVQLPGIAAYPHGEALFGYVVLLGDGEELRDRKQAAESPPEGCSFVNGQFGFNNLYFSLVRAPFYCLKTFYQRINDKNSGLNLASVRMCQESGFTKVKP